MRINLRALAAISVVAVCTFVSGVPTVRGQAGQPPRDVTMQPVGQFGGAVVAADAFGGMAYVGVGPRLAVLDVSRAGSPRLVGQTEPLPDWVRAVAAVGPYAYLADGPSGGLRVIDVRDAGAPRQAGWLDTLGSAWDLDVEGTRAYIADNDALVIIDVSDPANPRQLGILPTFGSYLRVAVKNGFAFVAAGAEGLLVIDAREPANPQEVSGVALPPEHAGAYAYSVAVLGNQAYLAAGTAGLRIIDIADPLRPREIGHVDTRTVGTGPAHTVAVAAQGRFAYVVDSAHGLRVITITAPQNPRESGLLELGRPVSRMVVSGEYAYVLGGRMTIIDVRDPSALRERGTFELLPNVQRVSVSGTSAHAVAAGGLWALDLADPKLPRLAGFIDRPGWNILDATVQNGLAYAADFRNGLRVLDVTDPAGISQIGAFQTPGEALDVALAAGFAYVADGSAGLRVIDVRNPAQPVEVASIAQGDYVTAVTVQGRHVYVADSERGLTIFDINDPQRPSAVGAWQGTCLALEVAGDHVYVLGAGLRIVDVSNPARPQEVGRILSHYGSSVTVADGLAFVASYDQGVQVIDVGDPSRPTLAGRIDTVGEALGVDLVDDYVFVADGSAGLLVLRMTVTLRPTSTPTSSPTATRTPRVTPATPSPTPTRRPELWVYVPWVGKAAGGG
jgi:hypothetical protein